MSSKKIKNKYEENEIEGYHKINRATKQHVLEGERDKERKPKIMVKWYGNG